MKTEQELETRVESALQLAVEIAFPGGERLQQSWSTGLEHRSISLDKHIQGPETSKKKKLVKYV